MLYLDTPRKIWHPRAPRCFRGQPTAHLWSPDEQELIDYALAIGMRREWLQDKGSYRAHFDLTGSYLLTAMEDETVNKIAPKELARLMMAKRQKEALKR